MPWTRDEIVAATAGKLIRAGKRMAFGEVVTDSNNIKPGAVFVALKGERLDGHRFVNEALNRGAACAIIHRPVRIASRDATVVKVDDTLVALGDLAHFRRKKNGAKLIAITGSNGKTTTKEMLFSILEQGTLGGKPLRRRILKTEGNFNNLVGLPLTLLRLQPRHRIAVVELGTNRPGEIQRLARIADPDMGIITSVAAAHLEGLTSIAGVAREKGALYRNVRRDGTIAVNLDDPWVKRVAGKFPGRKITYGAGGNIRAEQARSLGAGGMRFTLRAGTARCPVRLRYLGLHNVINALGAASLAYGAGVSLAAIRRGLERARPFTMRMKIERWKGVDIINDAYNANPASVEAAARALAQMRGGGARIAVIGDMFELGARSSEQHLAVGKAIARCGLSALYLLGAQADNVRRGAVDGGMDSGSVFVGTDHADISRRLRERVKRGDWVLVKGSRGMRMEKILEQLKAPA